MADGVELEGVQETTLQRGRELLIRPVRGAKVPGISRGVVPKAGHIGKHFPQLLIIGVCNILQRKFIKLLKSKLSCGKWKPRMLNISGIMADLMGKSTVSGVSTGPLFT